MSVVSWGDSINIRNRQHKKKTPRSETYGYLVASYGTPKLFSTHIPLCIYNTKVENP